MSSSLLALKRQVQTLVSQQKLPQAIELYKQVVEVERTPEHLTQLATLHAMKGDMEEASLLYEQSIELNPKLAPTYLNLANVQKRLKQIDDAIENLKKAVELKPDWDRALDDLAGTLLVVGRFDEACEVYGRLAVLAPKNVDVMLQYCKALVAAQRLGDAIEGYWRVLKQEPDSPAALSALGKALFDAHRYDELLKYCDHTAKVFPGHPKPDAIRAKVLARQGDWRGAQKLLDRLLKQHAPFFEVVTAYGQIARAANAEPKAVSLIERFILQQGQALPTAQASELYFTLGRLYDHLHEYDKAFANVNKANKLKYKGFNNAAFQHYTDVLAGVPVEMYKRVTKQLRGDGGRPVFIVGMPRSGTSLIEQVLDSHSQVFGAGELDYMAYIEQQVTGHKGEAPISSKKYTQAIDDLDDEDVQHNSAAYLDQVAAVNNVSRYVTDKMPQNFLYLGLINRLFPDAHVIHCVRNPLDTCLSCYFQSFNRGHGYVYDLESLAHYYRHYHELMTHWKQTLNLSFYTLQYERLIEQPKETISEVLGFLDLPWEDACMAHHLNPRLTVTASHDQVRRPIYKRSAQRWKNYQRHIKPLIDELDYLG